MVKLLKIILLLVSSSLILAGCYDYVRGISHVNRKSPLPDSACIAEAIKSVQGVSNYVYKVESGGRPLILHGIEKPNKIHRHTYVFSGLNGNFYFNENYAGEVEYHHTYLGLNQTPSQKEINIIRPVINRIEKQIEKKCQLQGFVSGIEQACIGVNCE